MARTAERLEQMARNHRVVLRGDRVECERCGTEWDAPLTKTGKPVKVFWLCPALCNISAAEAVRVLDRHDDGVLQPTKLLEAARDRVSVTVSASHFKGQKVLDVAAKGEARQQPGSRIMHARSNPFLSEGQE